MKQKLRYVGLDVHVDTIAVAVAEEQGETRSLGVIPHREESVRKLIARLGPPFVADRFVSEPRTK